MKIFGICMFLVVFMSSCFGGGESQRDGLELRKAVGFSVQIPTNWSEISQQEAGTPRSGEIALAYKSASPRQGYINNIIILKKENTSDISATNILQSGLQALSKGIKGYTLLSEKDTIFSDNIAGKIITYSGKYSSNTPEVVYIQTARICGKDSYYMTISLTEKLENYDRYEYLLETFRCDS